MALLSGLFTFDVAVAKLLLASVWRNAIFLTGVAPDVAGNIDCSEDLTRISEGREKFRLEHEL